MYLKFNIYIYKAEKLTFIIIFINLNLICIDFYHFKVQTCDKGKKGKKKRDLGCFENG